jgi:hypothetical protein
MGRIRDTLSNTADKFSNLTDGNRQSDEFWETVEPVNGADMSPGFVGEELFRHFISTAVSVTEGRDAALVSSLSSEEIEFCGQIALYSDELFKLLDEKEVPS